MLNVPWRMGISEVIPALEIPEQMRILVVDFEELFAANCVGKCDDCAKAVIHAFEGEQLEWREVGQYLLE